MRFRVASAVPVLRSRIRIESTPLSRLLCTISATTPATPSTSCTSDSAAGAVCAAAWAIRNGVSQGAVVPTTPAVRKAAVLLGDRLVMVRFSVLQLNDDLVGTPPKA